MTLAAGRIGRWVTGWLVVLVSGVAPLGTATALVNYRISGAPPNGGSIYTRIAFAPDGGRVVYVADHHTRGVFELFSAPSDGSAAPVRLNIPLEEGEEVGGVTLISPTSDRVVYSIRQRVSRQGIHYHVAPLDGRGPIEPLSVPMQDDDAIKAWVLTPDGTGALIGIGGETAPGVREVWVAGRNGGGTAVLITSSSASQITSFQATPDNRRLVYLVQPDTGQARFELYGVALAGGGTPIKLSDAFVPTSREPLLTPDGLRVVFPASESSGTDGVYSAPVDRGGAAVRLTPPLPAGGSIDAVRLVGDGRTVLYGADQTQVRVREVFRVAADGTESPVPLNAALESGQSVKWWSASPDGLLVTYIAQHAGDPGPAIWVVPAIGGAARRVAGPFLAGASAAYAVFSPDSRRVLYVAGEGTDIPYYDPTWELFSVLADGTGTSVKLNAPLGVTHTVNRILPPWPNGYVAGQNGYVVYDAVLLTGSRPGGLGASDYRRLYAVPIDGSHPATLLTPPAGAGNSTDRLPVVSADGARVAFVTSRHYDDPAGVYVAATDGSAPAVRIDASAVPDGRVSNVTLSPNGEWAVYEGNDEGTHAIYAVRIDAPAPPRSLMSLNGNAVLQVDFSPDSRRIVFAAHVGEWSEGPRLFSGPVDGSAPMVSLPGVGKLEDYALSPDGTRVAFRAQTDTWSGELFTVAADGGSEAVKLSPPIAPLRWVAAYAFTPDSRYVVFRSEIEEDDIRSLFSAPADGGGSAIPLYVATGNFSVEEFELTPDGRAVLYYRPAAGTESAGVYLAAVDGSEQRLLAASSETDPIFSSLVAGSRFVYLRSLGPNAGRAFFSASLDDGGAPQPLDCVASRFGPRPEAMLVTSDYRNLVYALDRPSLPAGEPWGVYTCPLDGAGAGVRLDAALGNGESAYLNALSPDGRWVVFGTMPGWNLWSRVADGSGGAKLLAAGAGMHAVSPDSRQVLLSRVGGDNLEVARLDGSALPVSVIPALPPSDLSGYDHRRLREDQFTADSRAVVYVADQEVPGSYGLWVTRLDAGPAACPGDCNGDAGVTIDEVIVGVRIAVGIEPISSCATLDADASGSVTVDELVAAVQRVLVGCT